MADSSNLRLRTDRLIAAPHLCWLTVFVVLPLGAVLFLSLLLPDGATTYADGLSLDNYARLLQAPYPAVFGFSLLIAATTTAICLLLAFPLALAIALCQLRWHLPLLLTLCLPFWISTLIRIYALQEILGRQGIINQVLISLSERINHLLPFIPRLEPLELLYNRTGVLIGLVYAFIPFAVLPIYANLARIDHQLLEASRDLGSSTLNTVLRIVLPLSAPGLTAAAALIFIPTLGAFYVVDMLGGPEDLLIGNLVQLQFHEANNWPLGAALSIAMLILTLLALHTVGQIYRKSHG